MSGNLLVINRKAHNIECIHLKDDGGCKSGNKVGCPLKDKRCCLLCVNHSACFTHNWIGCTIADHYRLNFLVGDDEYDFMWVNNNEESICPIDGHL